MKTEVGSRVPIIIGVAVAAAAVIVAVVVIGIRVGKGTQTQGESEKRNVIVTENNVQEVMEELSQQADQESVAPGYYTVTMSNEWHFADGEAVSEDAYVANDERNTNDIYFDVVLAENEEEVIYQSPVIPLGAELRDVALDTSLDAGTYDCIMIYHLVDEEQNTVDTLRVRLVIMVVS